VIKNGQFIQGVAQIDKYFIFQSTGLQKLLLQQCFWLKCSYMQFSSDQNCHCYRRDEAAWL